MTPPATPHTTSYAPSAGEPDSRDNDRPRGLLRWLTATNHKDIGTLYLFVAATTGLAAVSLSIVMRLELQSPGVQWLVDSTGAPNGQLYNVIVTAHGLYMMFFVIIPAMFGC